MLFFLGIYGYHGNKKIPFLKVTVAIPRLIAPSKRILENGFQCPGYPNSGFQTYESNIDFEIRYEKRCMYFDLVCMSYHLLT